LTRKRTIVLMAIVIVALGVLLTGALIAELGYSQIARVIVGGWFVFNVALFIVAELWLWRSRVLQRRALREVFPRAYTRSAR